MGEHVFTCKIVHMHVSVCIYVSAHKMCTGVWCMHTHVHVSMLVSHTCMCEIHVCICMVFVPGLSLESLTDLCSVRSQGGLCSSSPL